MVQTNTESIRLWSLRSLREAVYEGLIAAREV